VNGKLLIDAIMRQTTVLVAQLSTAAGIRAPFAHVADDFRAVVNAIGAKLLPGPTRSASDDMGRSRLRRPAGWT
jgi:hypothetical protein